MIVSSRTLRRRPRRACSRVAALVAQAFVVAALAGCASQPPAGTGGGEGPTSSGRPQAPPLPRAAEPPPPAINLSGFPLPYRQGYADGCNSATGPERKDATRFSADANYRTGWQDGLALCRRK